ncbi:protein BIG GRAIN 1-like [Phragmites australis]|uniref:protein BIG GRAIN 1-like n=1 Tax=Phragmites australis TaxID=29695 RepID=UPI002D787697|nr:protein BIG GRAIN 1-like [Phragmites australis]
MERRGHCHGGRPLPPPPPPPPRRARGERRQASSGSFSASLLDAIYRSLDEGDGADVVDAARLSEEKAMAPPQFWWAKEAAKPRQATAADRDRRRGVTKVVARPRHSWYASSTTSSSDSSASYSSFCCSSVSTTDTESTRRRRNSPPQPRQSVEVIAADAEEAAASPRSEGKKKKSRPCFPGARIRPRSPSQSSTGPLPPSPATFACALKALFTSARLQRKPKTQAAAPPPIALAPPQASCMPATCSTAKAVDAPEASEQRSVRFCPDAEASVVRRRVEELVRSLEQLEEDEEGSDSSSDLFELESLRGSGGDELPVYGTTSLAANRAAIVHGAPC